MSRNRLIYISLAVVFMVFSAAYQSRLSAVLFIAVLCYPVLAAVCVLICSRMTDIGFTENPAAGKGACPRIVRQKGEVYDLWIYIRSRSVFPCVPVELGCNLPDRDMGLFMRKRIYAAVPPMGRCRISVSVMHRYRGAFTAEISRAAFFDPLRIICISRKIRSEATLIFLPRRLDYGELIADAPGEDSTDPSLLLKGEREEFSHVREYVQGDMIQLVHWKLTAKLDELMIKQYDQSTERRTAILCDYFTDSTDTGTAMKQADSVIETAIAIALASVKSGAGTRVDFGAASGDYHSEIRDMADFERFYELCSVMPLRFDTVGMQQLIADGQQGASMVFLITGRLSEGLIEMLNSAAENFHGVFVLADVNPGASTQLAEKAKQQRFEYLAIREKEV